MIQIRPHCSVWYGMSLVVKFRCVPGRASLISWMYNFRNLLTMITNVSFLKGMTEFWVGEVFLICRKIILIHGQGPGFWYFEDNRFK